MNKITLMGRLTKEPELRYTNVSGKAVCAFTLAVDRRYGRFGENQKTDFLPVVSWEKLAIFCSEYFKKGLKVVVAGRVETRVWEDEKGIKHYVTEIVAEEAYFADRKKNFERTVEEKTEEIEEFVAV